VLETAIGALMEVFPDAHRCVIGFIDVDGAFEPKWWKVRDSDPKSKIKVSRSVVQRIVETADVQLIDDAFNAIDNAKNIRDINLRSIMCAPLLNAEGKVFGMLQLDSAKIKRFSESDLEVFAAVAVQIGLALNFSRLHDNLLADAMLRTDLEQARSVQRKFLPSAAPAVTGYEFADYYSPARHLGGDYFDYIELSPDRIAIVLGDVVGKGAPAALNMVQLATEARATFEITHSPAAVMTRLNKRLTGSFITFVILVLDARHHTITITNAGHELPLHRRRNGRVEDVGDAVTDVPLSVKEEVSYAEQTFALEAGGTMAVFSDGFADAENAKGERFGQPRVVQVMHRHGGTSRGFADALVSRVQEFANSSPQFDDMCLVCLQRLE
jgi:serine phosphatase RsbU (regulator of sigma subunit)